MFPPLLHGCPVLIDDWEARPPRGGLPLRKEKDRVGQTAKPLSGQTRFMELNLLEW